MITIYSKANCPHCVNAKALLTSYDIDYNDVRIDEDDQARNFVLGEGHKSVPQIYVDENYFGGFSELTNISREQLLERVGE